MLDQHAVALVPYPDCNSTPPNEELVGSLGGHAHGTVPILLSPLALHCFPLLPSLSLHIPRSVFLWAVLVSPDHASFLTLAFLLCSSLLPLGGISLLFYHPAPLTAQTHPQGASGLPEAHSPTGTDSETEGWQDPPPITICHLLLCRGLEIWPVDFLFCFSLRHERTDFIFL